jgi:hypothetical protein
LAEAGVGAAAVGAGASGPAAGTPAPSATASATASTTAATTLDHLAAGALGWLSRSLAHFDPYGPHADSATHGRAKAALELALLRDCAVRLPGGGALPPGAEDAIEAVDGLVRRLWQHPDFPGLFFDAHPDFAAAYRLAFAALAPAGTDPAVTRAALAGLTPDDLAPHGKSPYQRLEVRYYADRAGVRHGMEPYARLAARSPLVTLAEAASERALTVPEAYALTHTAFYLGDFGRARPPLDDDAAARARETAARTLDDSVAHDRWDLVAELLLTQLILGADPLATPSGAAGVACLARAQRPDGALPGRSAALPATGAPGSAEYFRKAYHTTLVTALAALALSAPRTPGVAP